MFFLKKPNSENIKNVISTLPSSFYRIIQIINDSLKSDFEYKENKSIHYAVSIGVYQILCLLSFLCIANIKDKNTSKEIQNNLALTLFNERELSKIGVDDTNHSFYLELYQNLTKKCNANSTSDIYGSYSNICAEFISIELRANLTDRQKQIISTLIKSFSKDLFPSLIAEALNLKN